MRCARAAPSCQSHGQVDDPRRPWRNVQQPSSPAVPVARCCVTLDDHTGLVHVLLHGMVLVLAAAAFAVFAVPAAAARTLLPPTPAPTCR